MPFEDRLQGAFKLYDAADLEDLIEQWLRVEMAVVTKRDCSRVGDAFIIIQDRIEERMLGAAQLAATHWPHY